MTQTPSFLFDDIYDTDPTMQSVLDQKRKDSDAIYLAALWHPRTDLTKPPYAFLKAQPDTTIDEQSPQTTAFNIDRAISVLNSTCRETKGLCLKHVADALEAAGLNIRSRLPDRDGSHYAKDVSNVLQKDQRFQQVGGGRGGDVNNSWDYQAHKGDIAVWEGGPYGHIQQCVGHHANGTPIWKSDFTAREGNWTGLKRPESHGTFRIFRQHTLGTSQTASAKQSITRSGHSPAV